MTASELPTGPEEAVTASSDFGAFFAEIEPRLRRALVASYGSERGREATSEALVWAWEHWAEVASMAYPLAFLYRVGQTRSRERKVAFVVSRSDHRELDFEPALGPGLAKLSERQRVAVVLIHAFGWTHREVAELTGTSVSTVQNHLERGLAKLRRTLGVHDA